MSKDKLSNLTVNEFPFQTFDKIRYADTDRQGHVNNAVFSTYLETGRVEFLYDTDNPLLDQDSSFVIADLNLQLLAEINWPGQVQIGTGVTKIGNTSLCLFQGLYQSEQLVATANTVIVQMNDKTRKSHPLTANARAFLNEHLL